MVRLDVIPLPVRFMYLRIRKAEKDDAEIIARNVVAMASDANGITLSPEIVLQGVNGLFEKPELGFYLVAESDGDIVGSLVVVYEWSDWRNGVHWWIHSVYVDPARRRKGIYRQMYEFLKEEARSDPRNVSLNLSVNKNNQTARMTYESLGMKESNQVVYNTPDLK